MSFHLTKRSNTYYFRIRIPQDLYNYFPTDEIKKSLRTRSLPAAKILCSSLDDKFQKAFALLRSGFVNEEQLCGMIAELLPQRITNNRNNTLSRLIELYIEEKSTKWTARTTTEFSQYLSVLLSLLGDKPISNISRSDCLSCRTMLQTLPPNFSKKKQFKGMTPRQISTVNDNDVTLNDKTINKYLTLLSSFFKWAIRQQIINSNPAEGLLLTVNSSVSEEREVYSLEDLQKITSTLPKLPLQPEKFLIPMIAMYSGLRLDEICQLCKEDIELIDGVSCFNINAKGGKKLKTASSARIVPVHPELIRVGLLDHIMNIGSGSIWPNLSPDKFGRWGKKFGGWYSRFNRREITANAKRCFHSFRHTVANQLKQEGVNETVIAELIGHKNESITTGRYGKSYNVKVLAEAIGFLRY